VNARYFLRLAYDGTRYHGWQIQKNAITVQQVLNDACSMVLREEIQLTGCGRTDAGVHAREFFAHFNLTRELDNGECRDIVYHLNGFLERDIVLFDLFRVSQEAHARFSASARTYQYIITRRKDPFLVNYSYFYVGQLDVDLMNRGADFLLSISDFTSFSKVDTDTKTNLCSLSSCRWEQSDDQLIFTIRADRFLRNMVRAIVGTLLEMGRGKITFNEFRQIVERKNRSDAGESVPAAGLFLVSVEYPSDIQQ